MGEKYLPNRRAPLKSKTDNTVKKYKEQYSEHSFPPDLRLLCCFDGNKVGFWNRAAKLVEIPEAGEKSKYTANSKKWWDQGFEKEGEGEHLRRYMQHYTHHLEHSKKREALENMQPEPAQIGLCFRNYPDGAQLGIVSHKFLGVMGVGIEEEVRRTLIQMADMDYTTNRYVLRTPKICPDAKEIYSYIKAQGSMLHELIRCFSDRENSQVNGPSPELEDENEVENSSPESEKKEEVQVSGSELKEECEAKESGAEVEKEDPEEDGSDTEAEEEEEDVEKPVEEPVKESIKENEEERDDDKENVESEKGNEVGQVHWEDIKSAPTSLCHLKEKDEQAKKVGISSPIHKQDNDDEYAESEYEESEEDKVAWEKITSVPPGFRHLKKIGPWREG
ncbi:hypothetical protein K469DRAFT_803528 [Zopfia rhizophila CBS 207.26]|uniref:Uncharacterized protein n=1 Tax=Zopfia rhizophila CBS 207.26 TaxID=1314779 RepID=A0A6A6DIM9_9PEZI|nr:hypothetical protein K469DRAFT_803528 [Zopfia rhizophila CBS 207.26]